MPQGNARPDLRVIEGGLAQPLAAATPTADPSRSEKSGAGNGRTIEGSSESPWSQTTAPTREIRVLVCGSRTWNDPEPIRLFLAGLKAEHPDAHICVLHGGRQGVDQYAVIAAERLGMSAQSFGRQWLVREVENADIVLAFSDEVIADVATRTALSGASEFGITSYVISHDSD